MCDLSALSAGSYSEIQVFGVFSLHFSPKYFGSSGQAASYTVGMHLHIRALIDVVFSVC